MEKKNVSSDPCFRVTIKVYGKEENLNESHSFVIDDMPTGISWPIGEMNINIRTITLKAMRPMIQYNTSGHMDRRSIMFQEAMFIMKRLPNYYNRPKEEITLYRFGFVKKDKTDFRLLDPKDEDKPISDLIGTVDFFSYDLCLVPLTQIPPS